MTKEEITEARMISQEAVEDANNAPAFTDEVEAAVLLLPKALDALEEAYTKIEELKHRVCVVLDCNSFKREGRHWYECPLWESAVICPERGTEPEKDAFDVCISCGNESNDLGDCKKCGRDQLCAECRSGEEPCEGMI